MHGQSTSPSTSSRPTPDPRRRRPICRSGNTPLRRRHHLPVAATCRAAPRRTSVGRTPAPWPDPRSLHHPTPFPRRRASLSPLVVASNWDSGSQHHCPAKRSPPRSEPDASDPLSLRASTDGPAAASAARALPGGALQRRRVERGRQARLPATGPGRSGAARRSRTGARALASWFWLLIYATGDLIHKERGREEELRRMCYC